MSKNLKVLTAEQNVWNNVAKTFNRSLKSLDEDVEVLKQWLETQLHLPNMLDFNALRNFLILNKCSIEVTKQKIDNYYTVRSKVKDVYSEINPRFPYYKELNDSMYIVTLPELTNEMFRVCIIKIKNENLVNQFYDHIHGLKKILMMQEVRLREDVMFGDAFIVDCAGLSTSLIFRLSPSLIYKGFVLIYERVFSLRVKAIYVVNFPSIGKTVLNQIKKILKPKIFQRIHIFSDSESLKTIFPLTMLPKDYGGEGYSLQELQDVLDAKFQKHQDLFDDLDKMKVDEDLRVKEVNNEEWGVYGNFKNLDFD